MDGIAYPQDLDPWLVQAVSVCPPLADTIGIAAGVCRSSADTRTLRVASAYTKTSAAWAVGTGNGGLLAGTYVANTWYHVFAIFRDDTDVVDYGFEAATTPTLPTNYTHYRRIGSFRTDAAPDITAFVQVGDEFLWNVTLEDVDATVNSAAAQTVTLTLPTGLKVWALYRGGIEDVTTLGRAVLFTAPDEDDQVTGGIGIAPGSSLSNAATGAGVTAHFHTRTNTSGQIRYRWSAADVDARVVINTYGWIDRRGQDD